MAGVFLAAGFFAEAGACATGASWVGAVAAEARAVADYNTALAIFEFAKGTIQQYNNVTIGEGPLPPWVSPRR